MGLLRHPIAIFTSAAVATICITPITSVSNLLWLISADMPVTLWTWLSIIFQDFFNLGIPLLLVFTIGFSIAFAVARLLIILFKLPPKFMYALAGSIAIGTALFLMVELLFKTHPIAGNRTLIGSFFHLVGGYFGGLVFYKMINKPTTKTLIIRFLAFIPFILLSSSSVTWVFDPIVAASSFGFDFELLSDYGKNTLIRDMTAFFLGLSTFMLLGIITLNQTWFFSVSVVMACAFLFNLVAVFLYETNQNSAMIFEVVVAFWFLGLGLWIKKLKN